jgi:hypothetical protein
MIKIIPLLHDIEALQQNSTSTSILLIKLSGFSLLMRIFVQRHHVSQLSLYAGECASTTASHHVLLRVALDFPVSSVGDQFLAMRVDSIRRTYLHLTVKVEPDR